MGLLCINIVPVLVIINIAVVPEIILPVETVRFVMENIRLAHVVPPLFGIMEVVFVRIHMSMPAVERAIVREAE